MITSYRIINLYILQQKNVYTHCSLEGRLSLSAISLLDRFKRSLRFCHLEFDEKAIFDGFMQHFREDFEFLVILESFKTSNF